VFLADLECIPAVTINENENKIDKLLVYDKYIQSISFFNLEIII